MKAAFIILLLFSTIFCAANPFVVKDSLRIFKEEIPLNIILTTNLKKLFNEKLKSLEQPGFIQIQFPDSSLLAEKITLNTRGIFRKKHCAIPSLKLRFRGPDSSALRRLKNLKLVCSCDLSTQDGQLLLKEYLVYKIYNIITDLSFKVRLAKMTFTDSEGKRKAFTQYTFLVEDIDAMAVRNKCKEISVEKLPAENTDREHTTLVNIFQYMIGNTDWAVPVNHNIKLIVPKKTPGIEPYVIPYDFDFAGLVNAYYALPAPELGIVSVKERVYRGFPRTLDELTTVIDLLKDKKENIYSLINNFSLLTDYSKKDMLNYLDQFYKLTATPANIKYEFIDNARSE